MKDVMNIMKQVGQMQAKLKQAQEELEQLEVEGQSGGGLVKDQARRQGHGEKRAHRSVPRQGR